MNDDLHISDVGLSLVKHYETLHDSDLTKIGLQWKLCPAGIITIGYGRVLTDGGFPIKSYEHAKKVYPNLETITEEQAEAYLQEDITKEETKVKRNIKVTLLQHQFDALCSYFYNIGFSQTMCDLINQNKSQDTIYNWFVKHYTTANGKFLKGLLYRRQSEAELYVNNKLIFFNT